MDRTIPFLLKKYETKQPGEQWNIETEVQYVREYQYKQRLFTLDCIVNERITKSRGTFQFPKQQKDRARHLIRNLDFLLGRTTEEQFIVMILIYTKLEANPNRKLKDYYPILNDYQISMETFVRFLIKLNKYYMEN